MSDELLKFAFVAGELSPNLYGRTDLTKYDLAMAEAYNFFVDYRGGLSSRSGLEFVDFLPDYSEDTWDGRTLELIPAPFLFPMKIEADTEYNYMLVVTPINDPENPTVFLHSVIWFYVNGQPNLEPNFPFSAVTMDTPALFTAAGHNFVDGDYVRFTGNLNVPEFRDTTFVVRNVSGDDFNLEFLATGNLVDGATDFANPGTPQGRIARLYTLTCDYTPDEYAEMKWEQHGNLVRITHRAHKIRNLYWLYNSSGPSYPDQYGNGWELEDEVIGEDQRGPTITGSTASDTGKAQVVFAVTSVYEGDYETVRGQAHKVSNIVNYTATEGSVSITWAPDPDARYYNVYRSIVSVTEVLTSGSALGFVGRTRGTKFTDSNIIPDFAREPPKNTNPFAQKRVRGIKITAGGSGYSDFACVITLTGSIGPGAGGFVAEGVIDDSGALVNGVVINEGHDYNFPPTSTVNITGGGSGATLDIISTNDLGEEYTYPACSAYYQQRQLYAATYSLPVNIWGSQIGLPSNFDTTSNVTDADSFEFTLDTSFYAPIRHLIATQAGLLAMTQETIWLMNGGGPTTPLTAQNVVATPQSWAGAGLVRPLHIGDDLLYKGGKDFSIYMLSYNEIYRQFTAEDKSVMASHLFENQKEIISWAYQEKPFKVVWAVRGDGALLSFTVSKSEQIYAWTSGGTRGQFLATASMREPTADPSLQPLILDVVDSVYFVTQRQVNGRWRRCVERMSQRVVRNVEDTWCLDFARRPTITPGTGNVNISLAESGNWKITSDTSYHFDVNVGVGYILRAAGGIWRFLDTDTDWWEAEMLAPPASFMPETNNTVVIPIGSNEWSVVEPFTEVTALWHLEGMEVSIVADGIVLDPMVVTHGKLMLPEPASLITIGLPFTCKAKSLPITVQGATVEGKRKRIVGMAVRLKDTKGLKAGRTEDTLYDVERGGEPTVMKDGLHHEMLDTSWEDDNHIVFVQDKPLPVTMLSLISDVEVGDDTD